MAAKSSKYPYKWPDGSYHSVPYTQHTSNVQAAQRKAQPTSANPYSSPASQSLNQRLSAGAAAGRVDTPAYATPAPLAAATPIAAPPVVTDPFLTPTDLANQAVELANVDGYLGQIHQQTEQAKIDATQKLGDIDTAEGRNLEAADWNTAARGVAQSSIRDTTKAGLSSDAQRARTATQDTLGNQQNYESSERQRADTVIRPAINTKYDQIKMGNAEAANDAVASSRLNESGQQPTGADTGGGSTAPAPAAPAGTPLAVNPGAATQQEQPVNIVKNGNFYHYYPASNRWVFVRKAGAGQIS